LFPRFIIENAKMRSFDGLPLVASIWPGDPLPGVRILNHSDLVPDDTTDIQLIEKQSCAPLRVAIDGRRGRKSCIDYCARYSSMILPMCSLHRGFASTHGHSIAATPRF
jgi:hypothetical protein